MKIIGINATGVALPRECILVSRRTLQTNQSDFQRWFQRSLERRGISLAELARRVDSDYTHLWKIMRGDPVKYPTSRRPGYELTVAIGEVLGDLDGALEAAGYVSISAHAAMEATFIADSLAGPDADEDERESLRREALAASVGIEIEPQRHYSESAMELAANYDQLPLELQPSFLAMVKAAVNEAKKTRTDIIGKRADDGDEGEGTG